MAAFSGSYYCGFPNGGTVDHVLTQLNPVETYGKEFALIGAPNRGVGDLFVVISSVSGWTELFLDGSPSRDTRLRNEGDYTTYDFASGE